MASSTRWTENPCVPRSIRGGATTQKADLDDQLFV